LESVQDLPPGIEAFIDATTSSLLNRSKVQRLMIGRTKQAKQILENITETMGPDSILLINEVFFLA
jgi:hypothetical protein